MARPTSRTAFVSFTYIARNLPAFREARIRIMMKDILRGVFKDAHKSVMYTVSTWEQRPRFIMQERRGQAVGARVGFEMLTDSDVWFWLDRGTDVRYAKMSSNFIPKTRVGEFFSYRGRGQKTIVDSQDPQSGIAARGWSSVLEELYGKEIQRQMQELFQAFALGDLGTSVDGWVVEFRPSHAIGNTGIMRGIIQGFRKGGTSLVTHR